MDNKTTIQQTFSDKDGNRVSLVSHVHYSNVVTVRYEDGTVKPLTVHELRLANTLPEIVRAIRSIRSEA